MHYWRPDLTVVGTHTGAIFQANTGPEIAGTRVTFTDSGTGWQTANLASSVRLDPGQNYVAAIEFPDHYPVTSGYWTTAGGGVNGLSNGPLVMPNNATSQIGQGVFKFGAVTLTSPDSTSGSANYWIDITVTITDPLTAVGGAMDLQGELNRLAGTTGLGEADAANVYAGTTGLETVAALNRKAGVTNPLNYLDLDGAANAVAGTTGLAAPGALATIP